MWCCLIQPFVAAMSLEKCYLLGNFVGNGTYGAVREATDRRTGSRVAVKTIRNSTSSRSSTKLDKLRNEIEIFAGLSHIEHVAQFIGSFIDEQETHIVQELCGMDLFDVVAEYGPFPETTARQMMLQMLLALRGIHAEGICHRDIKLENWVMDSENRCLKLIDFGCACKHKDKVMHKSVGSQNYVAPEVLRGSYSGGTCDMWSMGVVLYILLCGYPPFHGECLEEIKRSVIHSSVDFSRSDHWQTVSPEVKELVCELLTKDPMMRPSAEQALSHHWFDATTTH